jgi:putative spermidine/putrescine transport system substrate-binding protein
VNWKNCLVVPALLAVAAAAVPPAGPPAAPAALVAAVPPGPAHDTVWKLLLKPYAEATQTLIADPAWNGDSLDTLKSLAPDLALVDGEQLVAGCRSGLFRKLDWVRLNRDRSIAQAVSDCGAGAYLTATALAWDREKFTTPPSWSDFWDVARHPGRRGLQRTARGTLEVALLADGVSAGDVYRTLRTPDGLDRAFRKLDQLKPFIQWWDKPSEPGQWLAAGKVLLTSAPAASLAVAGTAAHKRLAVQWAGSVISVASFVVPQNAPSPGVAAIALIVAADPVRQALFAEATNLGPAVRDAVDLLPVAARGQNASAPENMAAALAVDEGFWADNRAKLEARFLAWVAK